MLDSVKNMRQMLLNAINNLNLINNLKNINSIIKSQVKILPDDDKYKNEIADIQVSLSDLITKLKKFVG